MDVCTTRTACDGCPAKVVCHCLQVTEDKVLDAAHALHLPTLADLRQATGAGDGCTACHHRLRKLLQEADLLQPSSSSPI